MAGRIPSSFLDELVARSDIVEIIGARIPLKKAGRAFKACCPFHSEKTPSFSVSPDKQFFHCFGCNASGNVIGFLMQYEKLEFLDAVADLAQRAGLTVPQEAMSARDVASADLHELMGRAARFYEQNLKDDARARRYVESRGIDAPTAATFALGYAPDSWSALLNRLGAHEAHRRQIAELGLVIPRDGNASGTGGASGARGAGDASGASGAGSASGAGNAGASRGFYDRFRDRLMFPIRDSRGRVIGFGGRVLGTGEPKYLNSPQSPLFHKGRELYGLYEARQARKDFKRLLIVEGYMDVVRLHQAGITYAIATLGTATTPEHLQKIFKLTGEVIFCFDGDRAGREAAWHALQICLTVATDGREFKFAFLPDGHDPDTLVALEGAAGFEARLKTALSLAEYLIQHLTTQVDLEQPSGRAALKALAEPLFARLPDGVYRQLLARSLAARVGMPPKAFVDAFGRSARDREAAPPSMPRRRMSHGRGNLLSQAIALLIQHPAAAGAVVVPDGLSSATAPGMDVLRELLTQAAGMQHPTTAMLLERWRDRAEYTRLAELAAFEPVVDDAMAVAELRMALEKLLTEQGPAKRLDDLLRKAAELGLNIAEKTEMQQLLTRRGQARGSP